MLYMESVQSHESCLLEAKTRPITARAQACDPGSTNHVYSPTQDFSLEERSLKKEALWANHVVDDTGCRDMEFQGLSGSKVEF